MKPLCSLVMLGKKHRRTMPDKYLYDLKLIDYGLRFLILDVVEMESDRFLRTLHELLCDKLNRKEIK